LRRKRWGWCCWYHERVRIDEVAPIAELIVEVGKTQRTHDATATAAARTGMGRGRRRADGNRSGHRRVMRLLHVLLLWWLLVRLQRLLVRQLP
jgi:hypothetical protein